MSFPVMLPCTKKDLPWQTQEANWPPWSVLATRPSPFFCTTAPANLDNLRCQTTFSNKNISLNGPLVFILQIKHPDIDTCTKIHTLDGLQQIFNKAISINEPVICVISYYNNPPHCTVSHSVCNSANFSDHQKPS